MSGITGLAARVFIAGWPGAADGGPAAETDRLDSGPRPGSADPATAGVPGGRRADG